MEVYLLRHGIAADLGEGGVLRDADRPLTSEGWEKMREEAAGMRRLGLAFDYIFTSPYLRTRQTTEAVAKEYDFDNDRIIVIDSLAAGRPFARGLHRKAEVFTDLSTHDFERALIVGHQPDMSEMTSILLSGAGGVGVEFKKGALCALGISGLPPRSPGALLWLMTPKQLRMIGHD